MECTFARTPALERAYAEVSGRAFKNPSAFRDRKLAWMKRPLYKPEHTRIVVDSGQVVAGVAIVELPVRYGDAVLKMGGISTVATDPDLQGRGYGKANMQNVVDYMAEDGYDISFLLGIHNYYHRFGYRTALYWCPVNYSIKEFEPNLAEGYKIRWMKQSDLPAMAKLYEETIGKCTLAVVRDTSFWKWYGKSGRITSKNTSLLVNASGELLGYAVVNEKGASLRIEELAVVDDVDAFEGMLALLRKRAEVAIALSVEIYTDPNGSFARYCTVRREASTRKFTSYCGGPMLRLFNVERLFGKIASTLAGRWQDAPRSAPAEAVTLSCPMGKVAFVPTDGQLAVKPGEQAGTLVSVPDEAVTEMVMGYRPVSDILKTEGVEAPPAACGRSFGAVPGEHSVHRSARPHVESGRGAFRDRPIERGPTEMPETTCSGIVVIPTYNEIDNLPRMVDAIHAQKLGLDVLVVDDGSPDGTGRLADELMARGLVAHVIHRKGKLGLGSAYVEGFRWVLRQQYELVIQMDADFSHDPASLPRFLKGYPQGGRRGRIEIHQGDNGV